MTSPSVCSSESFPFTFFAANGSSVNGILNSDNVCIFRGANCGLETSPASCCKAKDAYTETGSSYMFIAFAIIFIPILYLKKLSKTSEEQAESEAEKEERIPSWVLKLPFLLKILFKWGLPAYITLQVVVPIFMRDSIQTELDVGSRNALIAAEAFLVPYSKIFQFIEDIVLVRVNYALGSGNKVLTNQLVHAGISGAFVSGLLASIIATILGVIPSALRALTNPGLSNDLALYPGCDFISNENSKLVLDYWMMESWAIPGTQAGMVLSGFLMGAMELETLGWIGVLSVAMIPLIWFLGLGAASNRLLLLSGAEFAASWLLPILALLYIMSPLGHDLREHTGVNIEVKRLCNSFLSLTHLPNTDETPDVEGDVGEKPELSDSNNNKEEQSKVPEAEKTEEPETVSAATVPSPPPPSQSTRELLLEGLKIMVMDVAIQFCISLAVYLALARDAADGYKLTALQSALPVYGIAYALGIGIMFKIAGPQLIAHKAFHRFAVLARLTMVCALLLVPLILGSVIPFRSGLAYDYGANACAYAKDSQCVPFFTHVFGPNSTGGDFTLPFTFNAFPVGASVEAVFFVLRAILLACVDLDYMLCCTAAAVIVYIPAIVVASVVSPFGGHAISYFAAMYVPQVVLIVLFVIRIEILIRRILRGEKGTWSSKRSIISGSVRMVDSGRNLN